MSANLSGANLSGADLSKADLSEADLRGADLGEVDLSKADLRISKNLVQAQLKETYGGRDARLPPGLTLPAH